MPSSTSTDVERQAARRYARGTDQGGVAVVHSALGLLSSVVSMSLATAVFAKTAASRGKVADSSPIGAQTLVLGNFVLGILSTLLFLVINCIGHRGGKTNGSIPNIVLHFGAGVTNLVFGIATIVAFTRPGADDAVIGTKSPNVQARIIPIFPVSTSYISDDHTRNMIMNTFLVNGVFETIAGVLFTLASVFLTRTKIRRSED